MGGFSYADVLDSAKGWAGTIRCNSRLADSFTAFYNRCTHKGNPLHTTHDSLWGILPCKACATKFPVACECLALGSLPSLAVSAGVLSVHCCTVGCTVMCSDLHGPACL